MATVVEPPLLRSTTVLTETFNLAAPALDGDIVVIAYWIFAFASQITTITANGRPLPIISIDAFESGIVGSGFVVGKWVAAPLLTGDQTIQVTRDLANGPGLYDLVTIRDEAHIASLYDVTGVQSGPIAPIHNPAHTNVTTALLLAQAWTDSLDLGLPLSPAGYAPAALIDFEGFRYASSYLENEAAGSIPQSDWTGNDAIVNAVGFAVQFYDVALAVSPGKARVEAGASIQVNQAGGFPLYVSPIGDPVYAVPPDPTPVTFPQPPFIPRPGQPFRPGA